MSETFEQLIARTAKDGAPFQSLCRKRDGTYQASIRSKYSTGSHNAFACGHGATPCEALKDAMYSPTEEDPLS